MPDTITKLPPDVNPLNEDHYNLLCELTGSCAKTAQLAQACENCNLDVHAPKGTNEQQAQIAQLIKQHFFPDRP